MNPLVSYFVRGCLATIPVGATVYILYWVVSAVDDMLGVPIPGLGLVLVVAVVTLIGFALSNVIGRRAFNAADRMLTRVPLVKLLYTSIRDLIGAFMGQKRKFGRPVAVRPFAGSEVRLLGFLTRDTLSPLHLPGYAAVYFPQAYNVAGQVMAVPQELIEPLAVAPGELITFLVSGGASGFGVGTPTIPPPPPDTGAPPRHEGTPEDVLTGGPFPRD
ncbi:MAG: DUF502 domain-containing protein [Myxococcales bacterium]|jgi:uncharacterized membrane protein|nr:DUF502 domain-containing protein [Myxococcales bacterium]